MVNIDMNLETFIYAKKYDKLDAWNQDIKWLIEQQ